MPCRVDAVTIEQQGNLRRRLEELGFDEVRFARIPAGATGVGPGSAQALPDWLSAGMHADMGWMERTAEKRLRPDLVLPGARSVIALGVNYRPDDAFENQPVSTRQPRWARYALYEDYHDTLKDALVAGGRALEEIAGATAADYRYYVDTGPVLEREWAARSGFGFIGKNAMLISRRHGNWLFLASILTTLELAPDEPIRKKAPRPSSATESAVGLLCGKCTRCMDACPTQALPRPGVVDARRCISYQTIENKGIIPRELRAGIGNHIYGCDVCLEVCPWNRFARAGRRLLLAARFDLAELSLVEVLQLTPEGFASVFRRTPIKRLKLVGLLRNACVVAGNSDEADLLQPVLALARHASPIVRAHAVWAVHRLAGERAMALLQEARAVETESAVLEEYAAAGP